MFEYFQSSLEKLHLTSPHKNHFFFREYAQKYRLAEERTKYHKKSHHPEKSWTMSFRKEQQFGISLSEMLKIAFWWSCTLVFKPWKPPPVKRVDMKTVGWYYYICIAEQDNKEKVCSAELLEGGQWFDVWTATSKKFQKSAKQESTAKYNKTSFYNISIWYVSSVPSFIYSVWRSRGVSISYRAKYIKHVFSCTVECIWNL